MPCSAVMIPARSPLRELRISRNANRTVCRFAIEYPLQTEKPRSADAIASAISASSASATSPCTTPVAGL